MFLFPLVNKEFSNGVGSEAAVPPGTLKMQQGKAVTRSGNKGTGTVKPKAGTKSANNRFKKEVVQKKTYTEEANLKSPSWNIYTGNPGIYSAEGDTIYFGTVKSLSDSAFLELQHPAVPKTVKPYGVVGQELIIPNQDWILGIILIIWMIFASVRVGFPKYLSQIFVSIVNFSAATRLFRQRGYKTMFGAIRLDIIFHLILPLSAFQIARFYKIDLPGYPSILLFFGMLLIINGFFLLKILLHRLTGSIAMVKEQTDESVFNIKLYYKVLGVLLLPFVTVHAVIATTNFITVWIMAFLIIIMYLSAVLRTIYLGHQKEISIFYLILYLCTLEILPLLLIFKLISAP